MGQDQGGQVRVFGLGSKGVNIVKSPIHMDDNELIQAQNAEFYREKGVSALRKRPALQAFTLSSIASQVNGGIGLPLPPPGDNAVAPIYVAKAATPAYLSTVDAGATWGADTTLTRPLDAGNPFALKTTAGVTVYGSGTAGRILAWDGKKEYVLCTLPSPSATAVAAAYLITSNGQKIYAASDDGTTQRVFEIDAITGGMTKIGADLTIANDYISAGCFYMGRLWIVATQSPTDATKASHVYSLRPRGETTWTTERTSAATGAGGEYFQYTDLGAYAGKLYVGASAGNTVASHIEQRTADGTWSTVYTAADVNANDRSNFISFRSVNGNLYVGYYDARSSADQASTIVKFDGSSWTTDFDLLANSATGAVKAMWPLATNLYVTAAGKIFKCTAGTWSTVKTDAALVYGMILSA